MVKFEFLVYVLVFRLGLVPVIVWLKRQFFFTVCGKRGLFSWWLSDWLSDKVM